MLQLLRVQNFALIDELEARFGPGLNLITGETGSGKSILVDAVSMLLGERASQEMVRQGRELARIEGLFAPLTAGIREQLSRAGLEGDSSEELIVRREVSLDSNNRVFLNGSLSTLGLLSDIGLRLGNVFGQHEQQSLLRSSRHTDYLENYAGLLDLRRDLQGAFAHWMSLRDGRRLLEENARERLMRLDLLRFQISEIEQLQLRPGLERDLEEERSMLATAEKRLGAARRAYLILYEREDSLIEQLEQVRKESGELGELDPKIGDLEASLEEFRYQLEEIAFRLRDYAEEITFEPDRLEQVEERLDEIHKAGRKYGGSVEKILEYLEAAKAEVDQLTREDSRAEDLQEAEQKAEAGYREIAQHLSHRRREAAVRLEEDMHKELSELSMKYSRFVVEFHPLEEASATGLEGAEFLFSANPGESPRPLAKVASGGELSRIMLALKTLQTGEREPLMMVFDEVDAGIGGRIATTLGQKLASLSERHQVFCVTHLAQIAALGTRHFYISKQVTQERTVIRLQGLDESQRVEELARMMAGKKISDTTRKQAREMLDGQRVRP